MPKELEKFSFPWTQLQRRKSKARYLQSILTFSAVKIFLFIDVDFKHPSSTLKVFHFHHHKSLGLFMDSIYSKMR